MGSRHISETFRRNLLRTDKAGLQNFLEEMRELEKVRRDQYVRDMTAYERKALERIEVDLESDTDYTREYAEKEIKPARERLEQSTRSARQSTNLTATLRGNGNRTEQYSGTPEEFVSENMLSKYSSISIRVSGQMSHPDIDVYIHRLLGITVTLDTGNMQFYESAKLKLPSALSRISHPLSWLFAFGGVPLTALFGLLLSMLMIVTKAYPKDVFSFSLWFVVSMTLVIPKNYFFPNVQIVDEPRLARKLLKRIGWAFGSLAIGVAGAYVFLWLNSSA